MPTVTLPRERALEEGCRVTSPGGTHQAGSVGWGRGGQIQTGPGTPDTAALPPCLVEESGPAFPPLLPPAARNPQVTVSRAYKEAQVAAPCVSRPASEIGSWLHSRRKKPTQGSFLESTSRVTLQPRTQLQTGTLCAWSRLPRGPSGSTGSGVHPRGQDDAEGRSALRDAALDGGQGTSLPTPRPGRAELARPWGPAPSTWCVSPGLRLHSAAVRTDVLSRAQTVLGCARDVFILRRSEDPDVEPRRQTEPSPGPPSLAGTAAQRPRGSQETKPCLSPLPRSVQGTRLNSRTTLVLRPELPHGHSDPLASSLKVRVITGAPAPNTNLSGATDKDQRRHTDPGAVRVSPRAAPTSPAPPPLLADVP